MNETREIKVEDIDKIVARLAEMPYRHVHDIVLFFSQLKDRPEPIAQDNGRSGVAKRALRIQDDSEAAVQDETENQV